MSGPKLPLPELDQVFELIAPRTMTRRLLVDESPHPHRSKIGYEDGLLAEGTRGLFVLKDVVIYSSTKDEVIEELGGRSIVPNGLWLDALKQTFEIDGCVHALDSRWFFSGIGSLHPVANTQIIYLCSFPEPDAREDDNKRRRRRPENWTCLCLARSS